MFLEQLTREQLLRSVVVNKRVLPHINHQFPACISLTQYMRTNVPDVFCGGDLATFPLAMAKNQLVNIGHWQMAQAHGNVVITQM